MPPILVLWDDAHIWGLLAARALRRWGFPHRLVDAALLAQGGFSRKPRTLLLVPGGNARAKARALGPAGLAAVRETVAAGGRYLGVCGGAGLALADGGLGLCPWRRKPFENRLQHLVSGHFHVEPAAGDPLVPEEFSSAPLVPFWWPGQFDCRPADAVTVLARFAEPGPDVQVADLPLADLPPATRADWEALYGVSLTPRFLEGQPCIVHGLYGRGGYILSYAHLETPASRLANAWLTHILSRLTGHPGPAEPCLPEWDPAEAPVAWPEPALLTARAYLAEIIRLGETHHLLYQRTSWLLGWRRGLPGLALTSLFALVCEALAARPRSAAEQYWQTVREDFLKALGLFHSGVMGYLLAERLDMTLTHAPGETALPGLADQRRALFGPAPATGGLHARLQRPLEELTRLLLDPGEEGREEP